MVPGSVTATQVLTDAGTVVTEFSTLILLVVAFAIGIWGVRFLVGMIKSARG